MRTTVSWRIAALVSSTLLVVLAAGTALGVISVGTNEVAAGGITQVRVVRGSSAIFTTDDLSSSYTNIPGASISMGIPTDHAAILLIRFSGESACSGGDASAMCDIRILAGGREASPKGDLAGGTEPPGGSGFDSNDMLNETEFSYESHSMDRSIYVPAGTWRIKAQWRVTESACCVVTFALDDWSMTVEAAEAKVV